MIEACLRMGDIKVANLTYQDSKLISKWPAGNYKVDFKFYDDADDNIYNISYLAILVH